MFLETRQLFHWRRSFHKGREFARCRRFVAGVMMSVAAGVATAAPSGATVVSGSATVTLGPDTVVDQTSMRTDINWPDFDTSSSESVTFNQPAADAVAINRISGARTQFDGTLNANGRIFLINQNGITVGSTGQINTGSILMTTSDTGLPPEVENAQAQAGIEQYEFNGNGEYSSIINNGTITVSNGGFAVLAAPYVENNGFIRADLGQVLLASTQSYRLRVDFRGDGLMFFQTSPEMLDGEGSAAGPIGVTNTGTLQSRSGNVYLSANMAGGIVESAVNLDGVVDADQFMDENGQPVLVAATAGGPAYPGGRIVVSSVDDINIGAGADIHAVGGERVTGLFHAVDDISMGAEGDPARIALKATDTADSAMDLDARAEATLEMIAGDNLDIAGGNIEVTADAMSDDMGMSQVMTGSGTADASATAFLLGQDVNTTADYVVTANATANMPGTAGSGVAGAADAVAALDVFATGDGETGGDLTMQGDIDVTADSYINDARSGMSTANTVLVATGDVDITGDINTRADAVTDAGGIASAGVVCEVDNCIKGEHADANAALVMLAGAPINAFEPLFYQSFNVPQRLGTLSDSLTFATASRNGNNLGDVLGTYESFGPFSPADLSYNGNAGVVARANMDTAGTGAGNELPRCENDTAEATAAGLIGAGGNTDIMGNRIDVMSQAQANYNGPGGMYGEGGASHVDSAARSGLVLVAGQSEPAAIGNTAAPGGYDLTVDPDVSSRAYDLETFNNEPLAAPANPVTAAYTALLASRDVVVGGADPLAEAGRLGRPDLTARVQDLKTIWQRCDEYGSCTPVTDGLQGLDDFFAADVQDRYTAQLIVEAGGEKRRKGKLQPAGLFRDPVGPEWPGNQPLRFADNGRMQVATGADATRPPQIVALGGDAETAILTGADPSTVLPATASGGCVAAGRDAWTVSEPDYFDRLISTSCESLKQSTPEAE